MISRRQFNQSLVAVAFGGLSKHLMATPNGLGSVAKNTGYGALISDPNGVLDLPEGFSYQIISQLGEVMSDGREVPDRADGMGCFYKDDERVVLVRNHELSPPIAGSSEEVKDKSAAAQAYDVGQHGNALPGGTSNIVYNLKTGKTEQQHMSLIGTVRNCSGGITPWGSWLTCEESTLTPSAANQKHHGFVFEVPSDSNGLVEPLPLKAMGRFNHEAACIDPRTGIVYLTEDRDDSLLYRFIPKQKGKLSAGGKLQALAIKGKPHADTRNWEKRQLVVGDTVFAEWIDLDNVESPDDDLRLRGHKAGAALFARGEGIHWANQELFFCCTSGGSKKLGQIMQYQPSEFEGTDKEQQAPGKLTLYVESPHKASFNFGDNLTVAPDGQLIVCEDQYTTIVDNHLKGVTTKGETYDFARIRLQTEPAGACFSPDGSVLFVNLYSPSKTLAIRGPWQHLAG
ncbi:alkaline phosphatase PhoX [Neptunicella marina]|uniref:DUF839 domain-containing protein n=1 Tax=Neptunicella marina TaxID=2125989 RepID=A0A8J6LWK7_9ALTE|nr:DUF839 domain-containing protein [Neptunicella marina]